MPKNSNANSVTLSLQFDVTYELNGVPIEYLKTELAKAPPLLVAYGMLSGDSPAQVREFTFKIEAIK